MTYSNERHFTTKTDLFGYFCDLQERGYGNEHVIGRALDEIEHHSFSLSELAGIVSHLGCDIKCLKATDFRAFNSMRRTVPHHIQPWLDKAIISLGHPPETDKLAQRNIDEMLRGIAMMGIHPGKTFFEVWKPHCLHHLRARTFAPVGLKNIADSFAELGEYPGDMIVSLLCSQLSQGLHRGNIPEKDQLCVLRALAILDMLSPNDTLKKTAHLFYQKCANENQILTLQVAHHFGFNIDWVWRAETSETSRHELEIVCMFARILGTERVKWQRPIMAIGHYPDSVIKPADGNGRNAFVQCDGPQHFNGTQPNGGTILMSGLIEEARPADTAIRLPYWVSDEWRNMSEGKLSVAEAFLKEAEVLPAGAHLYLNGHGGFQPMFEQDQKTGRLRYTACTHA